MLGGAAQPTLHYDVPISRVAAARAQFDEAPITRMAEPVHPIAAESILAEPIQAAHIAAPAIHAAPIEVQPIVVQEAATEDDRTWEEHLSDEEMSQELVGSGHLDDLDEVPAVEAAAPELIPVPRSVFDDDFFRVPARQLLAQDQAVDTRMPSARGFDSPDSTRPIRLQYEEANRAIESILEPSVAEPAVRVPPFTGSVVRETTEADELDIPAFLRRGH